MAILSSLHVPPAMKRSRHADIALLDASQAELDKLVWAEHRNERYGSAFTVKKLSAGG